jgi:hypothetical protein
MTPGGPSGWRRDDEVSAPVFLGASQRVCRQNADTTIRLVLVVHGAFVDGRGFGCQLDRAGQHGVFRYGKSGFYGGVHRVDDLVDEGPDFGLASSRDCHFIGKNHLRYRQFVFFRVIPQFFHCREWVFGRVLLRRRVPFPLDEPAAHGVVLLLQQHGVPARSLQVIVLG